VLTGLLERDYADATPEHLAEVSEARAAAETAVETLTVRMSSLERCCRRRVRDAHSAALPMAGRTKTSPISSGCWVWPATSIDAATGALAVADRDLTTIAERLAAIPYDADRHLLLARAAAQATRLGQAHRRPRPGRSR
jgi:hypothetical protein